MDFQLEISTIQITPSAHLPVPVVTIPTSGRSPHPRVAAHQYGAHGGMQQPKAVIRTNRNY
jgi:hypothetical protein